MNDDFDDIYKDVENNLDELLEGENFMYSDIDLVLELLEQILNELKEMNSNNG